MHPEDAEHHDAVRCPSKVVKCIASGFQRLRGTLHDCSQAAVLDRPVPRLHWHSDPGHDSHEYPRLTQTVSPT